MTEERNASVSNRPKGQPSLRWRLAAVVCRWGRFVDVFVSDIDNLVIEGDQTALVVWPHGRQVKR